MQNTFAFLCKTLISSNTTGYDSSAALRGVKLEHILNILRFTGKPFENGILNAVHMAWTARQQTVTWEALHHTQPPESREQFNALYLTAHSQNYTASDAYPLLKHYFALLNHHGMDVAVVAAKQAVAEGRDMGEVFSELAGTVSSLNPHMGEIYSSRDSAEVVTARHNLRKERMRSIAPIRSGLAGIDNVIGAFYPGLGDFICLAGYTNHGKTPFLLNMVYQAAITGHNGVVFALEDTPHKMMAALYSMHSAHPKFANIHPPIPNWKLLKLVDAVDTSRDLLTASEQKFLEEHVVPDWNNLPGSVLIPECGPGLNVTRIKAVLMEAGSDPNFPLSYYAIDPVYMLNTHTGKNDIAERPKLIQDLRQLCLGFNGGMGIAGFILAQTKQEEVRKALKNQEGGFEYEEGGCITFSAEIVQSCSVVYTILQSSEMREYGFCNIQCHKARNSRKGETFMAKFDGDTQRIFNAGGSYSTPKSSCTDSVPAPQKGKPARPPVELPSGEEQFRALLGPKEPKKAKGKRSAKASIDDLAL